MNKNWEFYVSKNLSDMKKELIYLFVFSLLFSMCTPPMEPRVISAKMDYGAVYYAEEPKALLVLFPGFGGDDKSIEREFTIIEAANQRGIDVLLMNFNQRLTLSSDELNSLATQVSKEYTLIGKELPMYIGGYSSGGNVSFLLADHLLADTALAQPAGIFCVDSPLDLYALYNAALRTINRDFSEPAMQEARMLVNLFEANLGKPKENLFRYEAASVYTDTTQNMRNVEHLNLIKVRLYTEPDTMWWRENRGVSYEDMNAYTLQALAEQLSAIEGSNVELIQTTNSGFRADGRRHPHSWSIVEQEGLFKWMFGED
ncbi:MAG: hypothetical protein ACI898_001225 [Flavobacteriales bacterium]|jgi:hypothetical protein